MTDSREYPARPIPGVGVVVRKENQVLLIRRGNPPRRGEWSIPGGAVELGETWREAAVREVREECGVEITLGEIIDAIDILFRDDEGRPQYHYAIVDFAGTYVSGHVRAGSDGLDARWVSIDELETFEIAAMARDVILKSFARENGN
jgi:ADP-ribose pyrophosphatase